jgi:hypothetical protein
MINIFIHANNRHTLRRLKVADDISSLFRPVLYQDVFRTMRAPTGTMVFTDMDLLGPRQLEAAASMAEAVRRAVPGTRILNHPAHAAERFELLRRMRAAGKSPVEVARLDGMEAPARYPVFIRAEDGASGPETGLLENREQFDTAVAELRRAGKPVKGRVAISYEAEPDADGFFRKFGAFRIGDHVIPQHIQFNTDWVVKANAPERTEAHIAEEFDYIMDNPHRDLVRDAFDVGNLQFGRADFGFKDGRFVLYEINSNPSFPRFAGGDPAREKRRGHIRALICEALRSIDDGKTGGARVPFLPLDPYRDFQDTRSWSPWATAMFRLRLIRRKRGI